MKRAITILLVLTMTISLGACETAQERANRKIREANAAYELEKAKLDALENELDHVRRQIEQAKGK